jgi:hypothetical protein
MKTIPNPTFAIKLKPDSEKPATAADLLRLTLDQIPAGGFDRVTIRARARIDTVLDATEAGKEIALEDADYAVAQKCVEEFRWGTRHADISRFLELFGL